MITKIIQKFIYYNKYESVIINNKKEANQYTNYLKRYYKDERLIYYFVKGKDRKPRSIEDLLIINFLGNNINKLKINYKPKGYIITFD
jgi:hypothetical protein